VGPEGTSGEGYGRGSGGSPPDDFFLKCSKMVASRVSLECVSNNFYVNKISYISQQKFIWLLV
jgi:hypothetical protein